MSKPLRVQPIKAVQNASKYEYDEEFEADLRRQQEGWANMHQLN